jgi:acetate kinase
MILFEPGLTTIHRYLESPAGRQLCEIPLQTNLSELPSTVFPSDAVSETETIGYVLLNGGKSISQPVTRITAASHENFLTNPAILPDGNVVFSRLVREGLDRFPASRHFILCETAFFNSLPDRARYYALPLPWREDYVRSGCGGLTHAWAYRAAGSPGRMVSIHLDDHPSIAAIKRGSAIETSGGFSTLDGLPSLTGCGSVDPTIVIDLLRQGMIPARVRELLTQESGFQVFASGATTLAEITAREELPRRMLLNGLLEAAGSALAALGGADLIAVVSDGSAGWQPVIANLREGLAFLNDSFMGKNKLSLLTTLREDILFETLGSYFTQPGGS